MPRSWVTTPPFARGFPAYARATGTGFALGICRAGAGRVRRSSPGILFDHLGKQQLLPVSIVMAAGSLIGVVLLLKLPLRDADSDLFETPDRKGA